MSQLTGTTLCLNSDSEVKLLPVTGSQPPVKAQPPTLPELQPQTGDLLTYCNPQPAPVWPIRRIHKKRRFPAAVDEALVQQLTRIVGLCL